MKQCRICKQVKPESEYYVRDKDRGTRYTQCIPCHSQKHKQYYEQNREKVIENAKRWASNNPERHREIAKRYRQNHSEEIQFYQRIYKENRPERKRAHRIVAYAVRTGQLIRPSKCGRCGRDCKPQAHHSDYFKPLTIEWLCVECHLRHHKQHGW